MSRAAWIPLSIPSSRTKSLADDLDGSRVVTEELSRMFLHESAERCPRCEEVTPHSRRRIALPKVAATTAGLGAVWCCWRGSGWFVVAGGLLAAGLLGMLYDREKLWHVHCERCRTKKLALPRKTKPTLDGNTEINIV